MDPKLQAFALTQVWQLPFLIIYIVGVVVACVHPKLGRVRPFAIAAFAVFIAGTLVQAGQMYQVMVLREPGTFEANSLTYFAYSAAMVFLRLAGLGLLFVALFGERDKPSAALR